MKLKECPICKSVEIRPPKDGDPFVWCKNTICLLYDLEFHVDKWNDENRRFE